MRDFEVNQLGETRLAELSPEWFEVVNGREPIAMVVCEFGPAEEVIAMILFSNGTYEVGVGESLRPYQCVYWGNDRSEAHEAWWNTVIHAADWSPTPEEQQEYLDDYVESHQGDVIQAVADKFEITTDEVHDYLTRETIEEGSKVDKVCQEYYALLDRGYKASIA